MDTFVDKSIDHRQNIDIQIYTYIYRKKERKKERIIKAPSLILKDRNDQVHQQRYVL